MAPTSNSINSAAIALLYFLSIAVTISFSGHSSLRVLFINIGLSATMESDADEASSLNAIDYRSHKIALR